MGRSNKLLPKHRGPYQVIEHEQSVYIIKNLVRGKKILIMSIKLILLNKTNKSS